MTTVGELRVEAVGAQIAADALHGLGAFLEQAQLTAQQRCLRPDVDEPLGLRVGQRPQDDVVDDGEDQRVGTDPENEREHTGDGDAGLAEQRASRLAQLPAEIDELL